MATKMKPSLLSGMHTAGIFSDHSVDGPEIGTLVAIVDRAKNLPNRRTIGKQDPYCAARLGKEAKKTATDIRGGQTPKWDQELRFIVYDSPDYYQLKVSVFNDDKKTDLIGETWVDLRDIIVSGGGQNDLWHTLTCRGKYAGEVRMEITFYDSRPKPEKPVAKSRPVASDQPASSNKRTPVKRRPLPSDPVTGEAPEHAVTPPRNLPRQPGSMIPDQSPLQAVEYNTPPPAPRHHDPYGKSPQSASHPTSYGTPPARMDMSPHTPTSASRYEPQDRDYSPRNHRSSRAQFGPRPERSEAPPVEDFRQELPADDEKPPPPPVHRTRHSNSIGSQDVTARVPYETPPKVSQPMRHDVLKHEAHRRAPSYPGRPSYRPYDSAPAAPLALPPAEEAHHPSPPRHHSYENGYESYRSMQATVEDVPESPSPSVGAGNQAYGQASPYDDMRYDQRSSPIPIEVTERGVVPSGQYSRSPQYEPAQYNDHPSPAPLNLNGRGRRSTGQYELAQPPELPVQDDYRYQLPSTVSPLSTREFTHSPAEVSLPSHSSQGYHPTQQTEIQGNEIQVYGAMPAVPPSLVPGVDPVVAQEVADRIYEERRQERRYTMQNVSTPPRGRQQIEYAGYEQGGSPQPYAPQSYDARSIVPYTNGSPAQSQQLVKARSVSPNPMPNPSHTIKRKSVSPAPPPAEPEREGRRLSGIPFGPDSYDSLNPALSSGKETNEPDPNAKIITHDGREIDPSDHLPMESWAPEPEAKPVTAPSPDARPRPGGAQPMPASGRRPLRVAARPYSQSAAPAPPPSYGLPEDPPNTPPSANRNRLQKRGQRAPALPAPHYGGSSPLAPISSQNYQDSASQGYTPPSRAPRGSAWDYPNENHAPQYGSSPGSRGMNAPPVPAKVPLPVMSGALAQRGGGGAGNNLDEWALVQEMSSIDIGTGRSRRHGGY